ncbi:MAG: hypothetical protein PHV03_10700 [Desulfitobacteriaceae bacterium]|nr:hypothetical protein [Desulfitobacteriaceae bacterium]
MAGVEKLIDKMKRQPNGIRMSEADKVLTTKGYRLDRQKAPIGNTSMQVAMLSR